MTAPPPIVIIASPRSGSSLAAALFAAHGVWTGRCRPADAGNEGGYFENVDLLPLRMVQDAAPVPFDGVLREAGWTGGPWLVKHSPVRWDYWRTLEPAYVLCHRDPEDCAASQKRRREALRCDPPPIDDDIARAHRHHEIMRRIPGKWLHMDRVIEGDLQHLASVMKMVAGIRLDRAIAERVIRPELWHGKVAA